MRIPGSPNQSRCAVLDVGIQLNGNNSAGYFFVSSTRHLPVSLAYFARACCGFDVYLGRGAGQPSY
jgi:hypothetical protein